MKQAFLAFLLTLFLCATAQAYDLSFDHTGLGNYVDVDQWNTQSTNSSWYDLNNNSAIDQGEVQDVWSFRDVNDIFTERFVIQIISGNKILGGTQSYGTNLHAELDLTGTISTDGLTSWFDNSSTVKLYLENGGTGVTGTAADYLTGYGYDNSDTLVAELKLFDSRPLELSGTNLGLGSAGDISLDFVFTKTYQNFFDAEADALANSNYLLSFVGGAQVTVNNDDESPEITGFTVQGFDVEFAVVPEPGTLLLLGVGLLGIAGVSRKRS